MFAILMLLTQASAIAAADPVPPRTWPAIPMPPVTRRLSPARPANYPGEWVTTNDYPPDALRAAAEGVVGFRITVDSMGRPAGCMITASSGSALLDEATCELVIERARFFPASDAQGQPTEGSYSGRVRWVMPMDAPAGLRSHVLEMTYVVETDGSVSECRVLQNEGLPEEGARRFAAMCTTIPHKRKPVLNDLGQPVRKRVTRLLKQDVTDP